VSCPPGHVPGASPRGRHAPSPTGRLHLGNARTALLAWLDVRSRGGAMVLRIEDNDFTRARVEFEDRIGRDLAWLGLDWDEGPDVGGRFAPYRQSERGAVYEAALARLETYPCTCTRAELRALPTMGATGEAVYPGTCRRGPSHPGRPAAIRWRVPDGAIEFVDRVLGPQRQQVAREVGDFVLRRADGAWAYQLAVVVDDGAMQIDSVLRGADLLDSTPRQILLQRALGLPTPTYGHVPLILGPGGAKLSKRDGAPDLSALRETGVAPERVIAVLARSVGLVGDGVARVTAAELAGEFAPGRVVAGRPLDLAALV
jgi:glutamyl-tRNA synthetase